MNATEIQQALVALGWPITVDGIKGPQTVRAVTDFQAGYSFKDLAIDGLPGAETQAALADSLAHNGHCGRFFAFAEFKSKGDGWIKVNRELVRGLDFYRGQTGPTAIVSGYRDPAYNHSVGGATDSQHLYGNACDLAPKVSKAQVASWHLFSGIGVERASGLVRHVDVRHSPVEGSHNTTGATPNAPTVWYYDN